MLQTTYDESIRDSSPASLMRYEYFRNIFDEARVGRIEFYGKVMDWHTKWSDEIRVLYHANFYRSAVALSLHHVLRRRSAQSPASEGDSAAPGAGQAPVSGQSYKVGMYADLSALPGHSEALFSSAGQTSLFYTMPWYQNFIQTVLPENERLRIYAVDTVAQQPAARALLLMRYPHTGAGWFKDRTLSGLSNYYTSMFGPVITPDGLEVTQTLDTLAAAIAGDEIRWDVVDMHPLATDAPIFSGLLNAFRKAGLLTQPYFCFGNWYLQVGGRSYAEYFDTRPSQLKSTITRKGHQFERSAGSRMVIYWDEAGLDEGLRAYEQIYAASWKVPEPYPEFIRGLCRTCAKAGWLRLAVAYVDSQPAAAQIWIVADGTASIYKLAYDERFARFSLGTILTAYLMEHVIDVDKVTVVDYLTGDDAYKKDWMSDRRERWGIVAFNLRTVRGALAATRHLGARGAKRAINAVRRLGGTPN